MSEITSDEINELVKKFQCLNESTNTIPTLKPCLNLSSFSNKDRKKIINACEISLNNSNTYNATCLFLLALQISEIKTFEDVRKNGTFRISKYSMKHLIVKQFIGRVCRSLKDFSILESNRNYLEYIKNLLYVSKEISNLDIQIRSNCRKHSLPFARAVLAITDYQFFIEHQSDILLPTSDWNHYTKEELAEGASYVVFCFHDEVGLTRLSSSIIDHSKIEISKMCIIKACKIRAYLEAEILIDSFDYQCIKSKGQATIKAPFDEFEKSIRLGYISTDQSITISINKAREIVKETGVSLETHADFIHENIGQSIFEYKEYPSKRIILKIIKNDNFYDLFRTEQLFPEEHVYIEDILKFELVSWDEFDNFYIDKNTKAVSLIYVFRIFTLLALLTKVELKKINANPEIIQNSLVRVLSHKVLSEIISIAIDDDNSVNEIISLISNDFDKEKNVFDMQYKPLIKIGNEYIIQTFILSYSSWWRNISFLQKKKIIEDPTNDPLSRSLEKTFESVDDKHKKDYKTKFSGDEIEIDFLLRYGDFLFIFECKHSFQPCNVFELRTSFDYIRKASKQLNRAHKIISKDDNERELYKRLGWECTKAKEIIGCIVSNNGMFSGLRIDEKPVRKWAEMSNFVSTGTIRVRNIETDSDLNIMVQEDMTDICLWDGDSLSPDRLRDYIKNNILIDPVFEAMVNLNMSYSASSKLLNFESFVLDFEKLSFSHFLK